MCRATDIIEIKFTASHYHLQLLMYMFSSSSSSLPPSSSSFFRLFLLLLLLFDDTKGISQVLFCFKRYTRVSYKSIVKQSWTLT